MSIDGVGVGNFELNSLFFSFLLPRSGGESQVELMTLTHDWLTMMTVNRDGLALAKR